MKKIMIVPSWTAKRKYNCPECNAIKSITHPLYKCSKCGQEYKLKVKF